MNLQEPAPRILIIDDDIDLCDFIRQVLSSKGHIVETAFSGSDGLIACGRFQPDLIILDVLLPGVDGLDLCAQVRQITNAPIIFLSSVGEETTILQAFDCGAIDYIVKPVKPNILHARVKLGLRFGALMSVKGMTPIYNDGYLEIDPIARQVRVGGETVRFTEREYAVLLYLLANAGETCAIDDILADVWGAEYGGAVGHVYTYIRRLRKKLEPDPQTPEYILSDHGAGYRFRYLQS